MDPHWRDRSAGSPFERACALLALLVPLVVTLSRTAAFSDWRDDASAVTALGVLPFGSEGWLGLIGAQAGALLPVGGRWLRGAWVGAFAVALSGRLLYSVARRLLAASAPASRLAPPLSLAAALTATLSPTFQVEGTVLGGAAPAACIALATLIVHVTLPERDARSALAVGGLTALTLAESHAAALALLVALALHAVARRKVPELGVLGAGLAGALGVAALVALALALRTASPHAWLDLGFGLGQSSLSTLDPTQVRASAVGAWLGDVGPVAFALSAAGSVLGVLHAPTRPLVISLLAFALVDLGFPAHTVGTLSPDPSAPARLLSLSSLAVIAALGVQRAALVLVRARLPFAVPAAVLLVVFDFTLVFVGAETSAAATARRKTVANDVWTDEALASLPPNGILLGRSEAVAYRLWAAQLVRGERPDVLVVPTSLLERGGLRHRLLGSEPALAPLLRDIALAHRPGEYALSTLADARPLFVERDSRWDPRLDEHVEPGAFWLRFRAHPLGRSDRTVAFGRASRRIERAVVAVLPGDATTDVSATRSVLVASLRERALFLASKKDRDTALASAELLEKLAPDDEIGRKIRKRFGDGRATARTP